VSPEARDGFRLLLPVKSGPDWKSRLALAPAVRRALAAAFLVDVLAAARASAAVEEVIVLTDEEALDQLARGAGAAVWREGPRPGLTAVVRDAIGQSSLDRPTRPLAVLLPDLPSIRVQSLTDALVLSAQSWSASFVPDSGGGGTTLLAAPAPALLQPQFGPDSAARHRAAGARAIATDAPDLRRDVDTLDDLARAVDLGVGARTAAAMERHGVAQRLRPVGASARSA
jgi:2-phospho-L-lactate guanylyltransferase